jgi:hypothetical protein
METLFGSPIHLFSFLGFERWFERWPATRGSAFAFAIVFRLLFFSYGFWFKASQQARALAKIITQWKTSYANRHKVVSQRKITSISTSVSASPVMVAKKPQVLKRKKAEVIHDDSTVILSSTLLKSDYMSLGEPNCVNQMNELSTMVPTCLLAQSFLFCFVLGNFGAQIKELGKGKEDSERSFGTCKDLLPL